MRARFGRIVLLCLPALLGGSMLLPLESQALVNTPGPPHVITGTVSHVRTSSAVLDGVVQPHGLSTTYYFQYGPTVAYGSPRLVLELFTA